MYSSVFLESAYILQIAHEWMTQNMRIVQIVHMEVSHVKIICQHMHTALYTYPSYTWYIRAARPNKRNCLFTWTMQKDPKKVHVNGFVYGNTVSIYIIFFSPLTTETVFFYHKNFTRIIFFFTAIVGKLHKRKTNTHTIFVEISTEKRKRWLRNEFSSKDFN